MIDEHQILTYRLKVKREAYPWLNQAAIEVNQVWNFCNQTSYNAIRRTDKARKWMNGFDLCYLTAGATTHFDRIGSGTIQSVCVHYAQKRNSARQIKLRWRVSHGARKSLGWIPFRAENLRKKERQLRFAGKAFRVFEVDKLSNVKWKSGCFSQDSVGDWFLCLPVEVPVTETIAPHEAVGIDLGLKTIATTSDGDTLDAGRWTQGSADKLAQAQRRGHKKQAKRIHRKIKRQRADALHKFSRKIVDQYQKISIGNVSSTNLAKTRMARSVHDSGWGMLKAQLQYKGEYAGRSVEIVDESYTSRACSECGSLSGPQGLRGLSVREWVCDECGVTHLRDVNAARNILLGSRCRTSVSGNESMSIAT